MNRDGAFFPYMNASTHGYERILRGFFGLSRICVSSASGRTFIAGLAVLAVTTICQAQFLESNSNGSAGSGNIGEYNADGSAINTNFLTGLYLPGRMVVSGSDLFVARAQGDNTISEYTTSGALINGAFITAFGKPEEMAFSGSNIFVASIEASGPGEGHGAIGVFDSSGAAINSSLLTGLDSPVSLAISGTRMFVANNNIGTISEYTTSGTLVNAALISGLAGPTDMILSGSNLFILNQGSTVNASLITGISSLANSMSLLGSTLLVADNAGKISEYSTSGATLNAGLVTGLYEPVGVAFLAIPEPSTYAAILGAAALGFAVMRRRRVAA